MTAAEIEQVIDYVMFLSMRGETELALIEEARSPTRKTRTPCRTRSSRRSANGVFNKWKLAQTQVVNPPMPANAVDPREHPARPRPVPGPNGREAANAPVATDRWPWATGRASSARTSSTRWSSAAIPASGSRLGSSELSTEKIEDSLEPEARRLGQPAPAGQLESRRLQGGPAADRHLLADRQGDQRRPDAGPLSLAAQRARRSGTWSTSCWHCPTSPSCSRTRPAAAGPDDGLARRTAVTVAIETGIDQARLSALSRPLRADTDSDHT